MFDDIVGNQKVKELLTHLLASKRVPHLLLFSGVEGVGKKLFAKRFASKWIGSAQDTHPDVHCFFVQGSLGLHTIETMKQVIRTIEHTPYCTQRKAIIIDDAHRMLPTSANALLKTLEEPTQNTLIILITSEKARLLPTIVTRTQRILFSPLTEQEKRSFRKNRANTHSFEEIEAFLNCLITPFVSFAAIAEASSVLAKMFEEKKKAIEALIRSEYTGLSDMNAQQRGQLDTEIEGAVALSWMREFDLFLYSIYTLYRDAWLISLGSETDLCNKEKKESLQQYCQGSTLLPLEEVEKALFKTRLSVEKSLPLQASLELLTIDLKK